MKTKAGTGKKTKTGTRKLRVTEPVKDILSWARAVQDSIIAGNYNIPNEMTFAINKLQDVVCNALRVYSNYPELPESYVEKRDKERKMRDFKAQQILAAWKAGGTNG